MNGKKIKDRIINFEKIGKWWEKGEDIDLVLDSRNEVIFVETKFKAKEVGFECYNELVEKSKHTSAAGKFSYILVSRQGFKSDLIKNKPADLVLLSLNDLEEIWDDESKKIVNIQESLSSYF